MITKSAITKPAAIADAAIAESAITACDSGAGDQHDLGLDRERAAAGQLTLGGDVTLAGAAARNPTLELLGASLEHLTGCYRRLTPTANGAAGRHREAEAAL